MNVRDERHTQWADLADVVLALARAITGDAHDDPLVVELTPTEINVMRYVDRHPGTSPTAVAAATGLQRSNLSRALRDLEGKGMIDRTADASDGRQTRLEPTARAGANLKRLRERWTRLLTTAGADGDKLDTALALLVELEAGLNAQSRRSARP